MDGLNAQVSHAEPQFQRFMPRRAPPPRPSFWTRLRRRLPFWLFVVLPTVGAGVYLFGFAANQYVSEAKFVVRGAASPPSGVLSSLLQGAGVSRAQDDTFAVQDYILSRDALQELATTMDVRALFNRPEADPLSRFPMPFMGETNEHLFKHYLNRVDVSYDSTTGVTALTVKAFRPEDASAIARALLAGGERLVNRMNDRQRSTTMNEARREVADAEAACAADRCRPGRIPNPPGDAGPEQGVRRCLGCPASDAEPGHQHAYPTGGSDQELTAKSADQGLAAAA